TTTAAPSRSPTTAPAAPGRWATRTARCSSGAPPATRTDSATSRGESSERWYVFGLLRREGQTLRRLLVRLLLLLLGGLLLDDLAVGAGPLHPLGRLALGGAIGGCAALRGRGSGGGRLGRFLRLGRSRCRRRRRLLGWWSRLGRRWRRCGRLLGGRRRLARAS